LELAHKNLKKAGGLTNNKKGLMYIYNKIGMILDSMGYPNDAFLYYSRSLSLAKDLDNTVMQTATLNNIALIYSNKGELDKALSYHEESF
jgi:tetratricopeptide (TPR) repeat protein